MGRISRVAWAVSGVGLLVILVAEALRAGHLVEILGWGGVWVAGWIGLVVGTAIAVNKPFGWAAAGVCIVLTLIAVTLAAQGNTTVFETMVGLAVLALAVLAGMALLVGFGMPVSLRQPQAPQGSVTLALAGLGVILLAGAFALLANGMPLGYVAFAFSFGMLGLALSFGAAHALESPAAKA